MPDDPRYVPRFAALDGQNGVRVSDPVEDVQFDLYTGKPVSPSDVSAADREWSFPVDSATRLRTRTVTTPVRLNVNVRDTAGEMVSSSANDVETGTRVEEPGEYVVELGSAPIKLYLAATGRVRVQPEAHHTTITFPDADAVHLGARTLHQQPARTLTTTGAPVDVMRVVSEFGGALKTTSCERSFPTLRGHPPLVELGDEVSIPGGERRPETGVHVEVPPAVDYVYPVASLAYYLGADVRPGPHPRLVTDAGFEYDLDRPPGYETTVGRVLRHVFTLDCLTRADGYYPVDLAERERAEADPAIDLDFPALYDAPLTEQVEAYLSVPFDAVEPLAPEWRLTADVNPEDDYVGVLPHLAGELAVVRTYYPDAETVTADPANESVASAVREFMRSGTTGDLTRGDRANDPATPGDGAEVSRDDVFRIRDADSATQTYIGEGFPIGANKGSRASYERQLTLRSSAPTHIGVTVICNDPEMAEEVEASAHYGTRDLFEFGVDIRRNLTREQLRAAFRSDTDFVHYIGHVDARGMQATDGYVDATTIDDVGVTAFFLNGCRSFRQGEALVDGGALAGIVTLDNVHDSVATEVGNNVARLLNAGWPLDGALELVREDALAGRHYLVVGDGSVELVSHDSGVPTAAVVEGTNGDGTFEVTIQGYPTRSYHLGTLYTPYIGGNEVRYLASGELDTFTVTAEELREFLTLAPTPVQVADERRKSTLSIRWSDGIDLDAL